MSKNEANEPQLLQAGDVLGLPHRDFMVLVRGSEMLWLTDYFGDVTALPESERLVLRGIMAQWWAYRAKK